MKPSSNKSSDRILRIGIMCNGLSFSAWEAETIQKLIDTKGVSIELLIGNSDILEPISKNIINSHRQEIIIKRILRRLYRIYQRILRLLKTPIWHKYQRFVHKHFPSN